MSYNTMSPNKIRKIADKIRPMMQTIIEEFGYVTTEEVVEACNELGIKVTGKESLYKLLMSVCPESE